MIEVSKQLYKKQLKRDIIIALCVKLCVMFCLIMGMKYLKSQTVSDSTRAPFLQGE